MALPPEIVEIILPKLSVKPLLRFKSVCKSWNTIISDPVIVRNHHHRQLSNAPKNLFLLQKSRVSSEGFSLVKLKEGRKIQTLQPPYLRGEVLCFCEGMILITDISYERMALWNPSTRTHTNLQPQFYYGQDSAFGICRDPITDDFKVVVANCYIYSVYSCKNKSWIIADEDYDEENADTGYMVANNNQNAGICVDGASYWVCDGLDDWNYNTKQMAYFDPRDDKFKILQKPKNVDDSKSIYLVDLRGSLCMSCEGRDVTRVQIWAKEKGIDNHSWKKLMTVKNVEKSMWPIMPQCFIENKIVLRTKGIRDGRLVVYDPSKKRFSFKEFKDIEAFDHGLVPYMDTLFFPIEKSSQIVTGPSGLPIEKPRPKRKRKLKCLQ